jgi:CRISPR-associated protein Cas1
LTRIVIDRRHISLEYATDCMIVRAEGTPPRTLPLNRIDQVVCMHSVQLTTQLIGQLYKRGIDLVVINQRYEQHSFAVFADQQKIVDRRCRQYAWQLEEYQRLQFAKALCQHKFATIDRVINAEDRHLDITIPMNQLAACQSEQSLRGLEGSLQRRVFEHWRALIPEKYGFKQRERRPPKDPVNAMLSLTYTIVHQDAVRQARMHGLDPQLGFYHRTAFGRQSLACDLMEPVRPFVEAWVSKIFMEGVLDKRHFSNLDGRCLLGKSGRKIFYESLDTQTSSWQRHLGAAALWVAKKLDQPEEKAA